MIKVNGEEMEVSGMTVSEILNQYGYSPLQVAVELNEAIISKSDYDTVELKDGDTMEIVRFVGGG